MFRRVGRMSSETNTGTDFAEEPSRRLAGVLVTDLIGSTALRVRLGDRVADQVNQLHERLIRRSVARFGAEVVQWMGDGVQAAFPSASAAVQAALAIQRANERSNARPERLAELTIRAGVGAGEIQVHDDDFTGEPLDDAVSLCERAKDGRILIRPETLDLIGTRLELDVQLLDDQLARVHWSQTRPVSEKLGLPAALKTEQQLPFVGRRTPRQRLERALESALGGEGQMVLVRGEAGIGKTRLSAEFAAYALECGAMVLFGSCRSERNMSYAPIAHAFQVWMESVDDLSSRLGENAGELVRLVPELAEYAPELEAPTESDAETERLRMYDAIGEWLVDASRDEPIVLILDSIHWSGPATLQLIAHILPMLAGARVLLVATVRPDDARAEDLVRSAQEELGPASGEMLDLKGLELEEISELLSLVKGSEAPAADSSLMHAITGGNPLHLNEILRAPKEGPDLPETIQEAMRLHMARLEASQRLVVESAAVLGSEFEARCLAEMLGEVDATLEALDAAVAAGILIEADRAALRYRFAHDVTRQTVLDGIGAARTTRLHERAGVAIETVGGGEHMLADLARHFAAAVPLGQQEKAVEYSARAAEQAAKRYANESAEALYRQASELLGRDEDSGRAMDLAIGLGEVLRRLGDPSYRSTLFDAADKAFEQGDGKRMARALITAYRGTFSRAMHVDREYVARLRSAVELVGESDRVTRAQLLALLGVETAWESGGTESRGVMTEAVSIARDVADPHLLASVLARRQWTLFHPFEERLADCEELATLTPRCADPLLRFDALGNEGFTRLRAGDRAGLDRAMEGLRSEAASIDQPLVRWMLMLREFPVALMEGRFDFAEECMEEARKLGLATAQPDVEPQYVVHRFWLDMETQPLELAKPLTQSLSNSYEALPALTAWSSIALRAAELGLVEAAPILDAMAQRGFETIPMDQRWLVTICGFSAAAAHLGDRTTARRLHALLEDHAGLHANVVFVTLGSVARYVGLLCRCLGDHDAAESHLLRAIDANREIGAVSWLVRSQLDYLECRLERAGSDDRIRELLRDATSSAERIGLPTVIERARLISECL